MSKFCALIVACQIVKGCNKEVTRGLFCFWGMYWSATVKRNAQSIIEGAGDWTLRHGLSFNPAGYEDSRAIVARCAPNKAHSVTPRQL